MHSDAHLHLVDLERCDPGFAARIPGPDWCGAVVAHDIEEFGHSEALRTALPPTIAGFGIHPQAVRPDTAEFLAELAASRRIGFIGEAGFDFFGDRPERIRTDENLAVQRRAFEFQLDLAVRHSLPLLVHSRKGTDLVIGYWRQLRRLPAVIFHGWPGRIHDAKAFLDKGIPAFFSFGTPLLRGARHARESIAALPSDRILAETDAPWQPRLGRSHTGPEDILHIETALLDAGIALSADSSSDREKAVVEVRLILRKNFITAFGVLP
jgi:TatD DNase family protein